MADERHRHTSDGGPGSADGSASASATPSPAATTANGATGDTTGSHRWRDCIAASTATRRRRARFRAALAASHCTIERAAVNGRIRSTPSSVSFCTIHSGFSDFTRAKPTPIDGDGAGSTSMSPSGVNPPPAT